MSTVVKDVRLKGGPTISQSISITRASIRLKEESGESGGGGGGKRENIYNSPSPPFPHFNSEHPLLPCSSSYSERVKDTLADKIAV